MKWPKKSPIEDDCDFELDDEIVNEEEFLQIIDQELDEEASNSYQNSPSNTLRHEFECGLSIIDQSATNLDDMLSPSKDQTNTIAEKASKQAKKNNLPICKTNLSKKCTAHK